MGDEKEFLTALAETKHGAISPIPFNVELQQVDPLWSKNNQLPQEEITTLYESVEGKINFYWFICNIQRYFLLVTL